jgi:hypothetical protein
MTYKLFSKKFQKNLVNSKNSSTFAFGFALNENEPTKIRWFDLVRSALKNDLWKFETISVVQASNKMLKLGKNKFPLISTLN